MSLPLYQHIWYQTKLKLSGRNIHFRPFTIAESKNLLMKKEEKDNTAFYEEISSLLKNCVKEDDFDPYKLYYVDFETLFYDIKSASDSGIIEFNYDYKDDNGKECQQLLAIDLKKDIGLTNTNKEYKLDIPENKMSATFQVPTVRHILSVSDQIENETERIIQLIILCLKSVTKEDQIYNSFSTAEAMQFIDSLPISYLEKVSEFFNDLPSLKCNRTFQLEGKVEPLTLSTEDMERFFA